MDSSQMDEFVLQMQNLGMTENEGKVYFVVFLLKSATVREIYDVCGVPRTKIYAELESLEKKGFVVAIGGKPLRFSVSDVARPIDNLRKAAAERFDAAQNYLKSLERVVPSIPSPRAYDVQSAWAINNHLAAILKRTKSELIFIVNDREFFQLSVPEKQLKVLARKTDLYVIVMNDEMAQGIPVRCYRMADSVADIFADDTGVMNTLNGKMIVISDREVILTVDSMDGEQFGSVLFMQGRGVLNLLLGNILRYLVQVG